MRILTTPNIILRQTAQPVEKFDNELSTLVDEMKKTMLDEMGIGLAAPQVGISRQIIVIKSETGCLVNPRVIETSLEVSSCKEGCLSIPGKQIIVERPINVNVEYQDVAGEKHQRWFTGLEARVIQHEIDHLNGVLMIDRKAT